MHSVFLFYCLFLFAAQDYSSIKQRNAPNAFEDPARAHARSRSELRFLEHANILLPSFHPYTLALIHSAKESRSLRPKRSGHHICIRSHMRKDGRRNKHNNAKKNKGVFLPYPTRHLASINPTTLHPRWDHKYFIKWATSRGLLEKDAGCTMAIMP